YYLIVEQASACSAEESAAANLELDEFLIAQTPKEFSSEKTSSGILPYRFWESSVPVVVLSRGGRISEQVNQPACVAGNIEILRRCSGGGAVVLAPGCLNYTLLFSLEASPQLRNVARSFW